MMTPSQADLTLSPAQVIRRRFRGGPVREGPVRWEARRDPLVNLLGQIRGGRAALLISSGAETEVLRRALAGACRPGQVPRARAGWGRGACLTPQGRVEHQQDAAGLTR